MRQGVDEESALHAAPPPPPNGTPLDEQSRKSSNNSHQAIPSAPPSSLPQHGILPSTRASIRQSDPSIKKQKPPPKLLHPMLHNVPMHIRFGLNGFLSNVLFMVAYNFAVVQFEHMANSSTIYATVYLIFIPVTHAMISLLVFGWPERYIRSLMSNAPVGLTAIVLGAGLTEYLDRIEFNRWVADAVVEYWRMLGYQVENISDDEKSSGEFYSSIFVLLITGIWTFVLSVMVNSPAESLEKKEL